MRNYSSTAVATTIASAITSSDTTMTLTAATGLPTVPFTLVLDPDTANEEIVTITARSGTSVTAMSRGQESTTARSHAALTPIKHMVTARDLQDAQDHIANTTTAHGVTGAVVGTTNSQTLTNKSMSGAANTFTSIPQASVSNLVTDLSNKASASHTHTLSAVTDVTATAAELNTLDGITASTAELNILDGVTATTAELNILDGVTATAAEINLLDGVTATTTELNYVDGVTSNVQTQLDAKASATRPYAFIYGTSSLTSSGTITFPSETYDSASGHDTTTNTGRYTATVAGYYAVHYSFSFLTGDTNGNSFSIRKNGTTVTGCVQSVKTPSSGVEVPVSISAVVYLNGSTDYVECYASLSSGTIYGNRNASIHYVSN